MKVLFQTRTNLFDAPGGDMIQLLKTKEHLEKLGVEVDVSLEFELDLSKYDLRGAKVEKAYKMKVK